MKKTLFATAAIAALGLVAPQVAAQEQADPNLAHEELYMQRDEAGTYRLFGPDFPAEGQEVLYERGVRPQACPEGAWFIEQDPVTDEFNQIRGCDTAGTFAYDVEPMPSDTLTARGEAFGAGSAQSSGPYEDTYLVTPRAD